jgi:hypothetical protein
VRALAAPPAGLTLHRLDYEDLDWIFASSSFSIMSTTRRFSSFGPV